VPSRRSHWAASSSVRLAGPGGINQVEEPFDRFPEFVLRVAAIATVLAPQAYTAFRNGSVSNEDIFTRSHVSARIRNFSTARLYLMAAYRAI